MLYFDTSYLVRLYTGDPGWDKVRALAASDQVCCCVHGRIESIAAFHRKFRESALTRRQFTLLLAQFEQDCAANGFEWLPLSPVVAARAHRTYARLPASITLRAADAIHLACAAESNLTSIYSNDARLLAAASHFGLQGVNVL